MPDVVGRADLAITKTVSPKLAAVGDILTYTVTVTNHGPDTAQEIDGTDASGGRFPVLSLKPSRGTCNITNHSAGAVRNVSVCDRLPRELIYVSGGTRHGAVVCWRFSSVGRGRGRTFTLRARAVASRTRVAVNVATVRASGMPVRTAHAVVVIIRPTPTFTG